ncbi:MAG: ABC transporter ATP-binding protein [Candidatus Adlerbacteria bacterium]|nr:ABC transporter ATP-binding protein [Candidatus Adlerbacteria bacterium]
MKTEEKKVAKARDVFRAYWRHTRNYPVYVGFSVGSIVVIQICSIIGPLFLRQFINIISLGSVSPDIIHQASMALVGFASMLVVIWIAWRVEMYAGTQTCARIMADLSKEAFAYLMRHSYQFFTSSFSGALTRRVGRYSDSFNKLWDSLIGSVLHAVLYTVGIIIVLWYKHPVLGASLAGATLLFIVVQIVMAHYQQPLRAKRAEEDSNVTAALADSISNHSTVQLFSGNQFEEKGVGAVIDRLLKALLRTWTADIWIYGVQSIFSVTMNIGLLWIGFKLWEAGSLTVGDFVLIQTYFIGLLDKVWGLGREFRNINTALADAGEMVYILKLPYEIKDAKGAKKLHVDKGEVWFDDVSFGFKDGASILNTFNLTIAGGERVALVGPSGAGKSTITKLLLRLYDIHDGEIKIDGQNISKVTQDSLRNEISFVPQEPVLFHRTLMENIRYGRRGASDKDVIEAAKQAHCHEFISQLKDGYNTYVGERGVKLSGGERQRVAIARAILKNSPILVLDEATSSLDSESEALIQDALKTLMEGKTVIVIAHRLSTIMNMDRIVVIENGVVAATGTHDELLEHKGLYHKLWSIQAGGFIADDGSGTEIVEEDEEPAV